MRLNGRTGHTQIIHRISSAQTLASPASDARRASCGQCQKNTPVMLPIISSRIQRIRVRRDASAKTSLRRDARVVRSLFPGTRFAGHGRGWRFCRNVCRRNVRAVLASLTSHRNRAVTICRRLLTRVYDVVCGAGAGRAGDAVLLVYNIETEKIVVKCYRLQLCFYVS